MRLQIFSDVHFDVIDGFAPRLAAGVDVVVVAGDVCEGLPRGIRWLRRHLGPAVAIVLVPGNHEYFGSCRATEAEAGAVAAREHGVALLDDSEAVFGGIRFIGSTLWTDFDVFGRDRRQEAMALAQAFMVDHRQMREADGRRFLPEDARRQHLASRAFIESRLGIAHAGPSVVVTHHGPHRHSLAARYRDDLLSAAFISDLAGLIDTHQPALWVHGHTHTSFDYLVGRTRVVCNPHGYGNENPAFDGDLVIDL